MLNRARECARGIPAKANTARDAASSSFPTRSRGTGLRQTRHDLSCCWSLTGHSACRAHCAIYARLNYADDDDSVLSSADFDVTILIFEKFEKI